MPSDSYIRKIVYDSNLIDRTFYPGLEMFPGEVSAELKKLRAKKIYFRPPNKRWKLTDLKTIKDFFKYQTVISAGIIASTHGPKGKQRYTQYSMGLIVKSEELGLFEVDIDFLVYFKRFVKNPKK